MILKLVRTPGIYLVGFMGSGKSTVGRMLADRLGWHFVDLDDDIEAAEKKSIPEIFEQHGEEYFRRVEHEAIRKRVRTIRSGRPMVIALGGGAFTQEANVECLQDNGVTVWLDCPFEISRQRLGDDTSNRPLARDPKRLEELYEQRRASYARAEYRIDNADCRPETAVEAICSLSIF